MCGIAGFVMDRQERARQELESIREDFATLLAATEVRGRDAAGAFVFTPGRTTYYHKQPGPASRMVMQPPFWALLDTITNETVGVVGHARWATHGSPKVNANNHPLIAGPIIGVHNGVVANYGELAQQVGASAQVDSEVIFRLLRRHANNHIKPKAVRKALARVNGGFALAFADTRGESIWLARNHMPLAIGKDKRRGVLWFASLLELLMVILGNHAEIEIRMLKPHCGYEVTRDNCLSGLAGFSLIQGRREELRGTAFIT
jgi:glucosamine 6-phosphate synthetase-like amidotransferase/phosphosugar isomerase protein